jgi:RNA polymerase sigma-70 factor (ECF subfamily)
VDDPRLSRIETQWTLVARANAGGGAAREAQAELLPRYCPAVFRYLCEVAGDPATAEELCQEFAFRFVRGDFRHAKPERGRFRDYVKVALVHLAGEFRRRARGGQVRPLDSQAAGQWAAPDPDPDEDFTAQWRNELIQRTWAALRREAGEQLPNGYEALRRKAADEGLTSARIAEAMAAECGRPVTAANVRQLLHRARDRFGELLRAEVAATLPDAAPADVDAELADLGLLVYCPSKLA